jgi:two-component system LytT family response regulator/two-component system response regulator LytT
MNLRALLADDEQLAREELRYLLDQRGGIDVIGQAANGVEALAEIERLQPDLVFLDVQMPGLTGFEVARRMLGDAARAEIVFVTAYDRHAIEAFEVNAVDYLLKPVDPARLDLALQRVRRRLAADRQAAAEAEAADAPEVAGPEHAAGVGRDQLERIVELVTARQRSRAQFAIKVGERFVLVQTDEIVYASMADETVAVATQQIVGHSNFRTLDELQARLDPAVFWRVHRSHLVNINKVREIVPWFSRNYILRMKDEKATEIPVSRAQTRRLRDHLKL